MTIDNATKQAYMNSEYGMMAGTAGISGVGGQNLNLRDDVHQDVRIEQASSLLSGLKGAAIGGGMVAVASMTAGCYEPSTVAYGVIGGAISGFIKR